MKSTYNNKKNFVKVATLCSAFVFFSCSSSGDPDPETPPAEGNPENGTPLPETEDEGESQRVFESFAIPQEGFSGYDGTNVFVTPLFAQFFDDAGEPLDGADTVWTVDDPALGEITAHPDLEDIFVLTAKGAGTVTATATLGDQSVSSVVTIASYTPELVAAGEARYLNKDDPAPDRVDCASCHEAEDGVDHSPFQLVTTPDEFITSIATTGEYTSELWGTYTVRGVDHVWTLTPEEQMGVVAYMRSLPLRDFTVDPEDLQEEPVAEPVAE